MFQGQPVTTIVGGPTFWAMEQAEESLRAFQELIATAPEELGGFYAFTKVPPVPPFPEALHGRTVAAVVWCFNGTQEAFEGEAPEPVARHDSGWPDAARDLNGADGLTAPVTSGTGAATSSTSSPTTRSCATAVGDRMPTWKAARTSTGRRRSGRRRRGHRLRVPNATFSQVIIAVDPDPAGAGAIRDWAIGYWEALHRIRPAGRTSTS
jgi:hypothetical protein